MDEKVKNNLLYGYGVLMIILIILAAIFTLIEIKSLCILSVLVFIIQSVLLLTSPKCYIFSKEKVVIKYFFGLEENILWSNLRAVTSHHTEIIKYHYIDQYHLFYYTQEKTLPFMQGKINKNKKTEALMKKYCPLKDIS